ncbi:MAG: efflux RND transporter periplasmic adaptor subunit [Acidobacteriaceae bacterium]
MQEAEREAVREPVSGAMRTVAWNAVQCRQKRSGRQMFCVLLGVVMIPVLLTGCGHQPVAQHRSPPVVEVATVVQQDVPIYGNWVGTLQGYVNAQIEPHVTGYLIRQDYREGSFVRKGQELFEIDPRPFQATLDQAKAQVAQAEAQLGAAAINVRRDIPEAKAHAIPQSQLDNDTQAKLAAQASVEAAKAAVETAQLNLGYTQVRSIVSGIAGIAQVQVGNLVSPGTVLTGVSQVNPIKVYFPITEQEYLAIAGRLAPGTVDLLSAAASIPLQLTLADGSVYRYSGRILFADRQVDQQTGTIQIVGALPNPKRELRPGQYARVHALTRTLKNALLVPQSSVTQLQGSYQVTVVDANNRAQIRTAEVGPTMGTMWVVTSGLQPNERVIAEGSDKVKNGEQVTPKPYSAGGR